MIRCGKSGGEVDTCKLDSEMKKKEGQTSKKVKCVEVSEKQSKENQVF